MPRPGFPLPPLRLLGADRVGWCPGCGADWKAIDVSHGPGCPKNLLEEAMDTPNGGLVRRCFRLLNAKSIGMTITLADITEEEFRVLELIETERQDTRTGRC
jgi:hypothetical protein